MATGKKAASRAPAAPRTPEEYVEELRRRAVRRLVSAIVITGSISGYILTHWPQEEPRTAESIASMHWEVHTKDRRITRAGGCDSISTSQRFDIAMGRTKAALSAGAPPAMPPKCAI